MTEAADPQHPIYLALLVELERHRQRLRMSMVEVEDRSRVDYIQALNGAPRALSWDKMQRVAETLFPRGVRVVLTPCRKMRAPSGFNRKTARDIERSQTALPRNACLSQRTRTQARSKRRPRADGRDDQKAAQRVRTSRR
jgi:hypothetical protein